MTEHKQLRSLAEAFCRYEAHLQSTLPPKKAERLLAQARTALLRYTLPGWGFPLAHGQRLTPQECEQGLQFMHQIALEQLQDAPQLQDALFEQLGVAGNSRRNYRWALKAFLDWCKQQDGSNALSGSLPRQASSRQREKKRSAAAVRTTPYKARLPYQLSREEMPLTLQQELEAFHQFLTQTQQTLHHKSAVSVVTARQTEQQVLRFLGWLAHVQGVPLDALSLQTLVPVAPAHQGKPDRASVNAASGDLVELVQAYLEWLQGSRLGHAALAVEATLNPHTVRKVLDTWLTVGRFVYRQELDLVGWKNEKAVPPLAALRKLRQKTAAKQPSHRLVSDQSKQLMDWTEFLDLVERLRGECSPCFPQKTQSKQAGTTRGARRSLTAIAHSYQRFLCAAFLAYLPPLRQQELRQLKVSSASASSLERLPSHDPRMENLLYQHGQQWRLSLAPHKTRHGLEATLVVPNLCYADGRCFYQYLTEWLLHYDTQDEQDQPVVVRGLRSCFDPQHDYLFTLKNGQPYSSAPAFMALLRNPAYRLAGQVLTPHAVRNMFITHLAKTAKTHALSALELQHLAHTMGLSYKTFLQQYEARRLDTTNLSTQAPEPEAKEGQAIPPELTLRQEDKQWTAEIAQAFLDETAIGAAQRQKAVSASLSLP